MTARRVRALVHGRVQGVFFRDSTRRQARALGVQGHARNLSDGTVEVVAQGTPDAIDALLAFLRTGPPRARVTQVEVQEESAEGELDGFSIG
jgi:acylphosphatase